MSVLTVPRIRRPRDEQPEPAAEVAWPLVDWEAPRDGLWVGRIGLDRAGAVHRFEGGYVLEDWDGAALGTYRTLHEAQRHLEPEVRAADREAAERAERSIAPVAGRLAVSATSAALVLGASWMVLQSL